MRRYRPLSRVGESLASPGRLSVRRRVRRRSPLPSSCRSRGLSKITAPGQVRHQPLPATRRQKSTGRPFAPDPFAETAPIRICFPSNKRSYPWQASTRRRLLARTPKTLPPAKTQLAQPQLQPGSCAHCTQDLLTSTRNAASAGALQARTEISDIRNRCAAGTFAII
jgi:hypothetical protein